MTGRGPAVYDSGERPAAAGNVSERSRGLALALAVIGGVFGLHRFYAGRAQSGVWMCLTLGGAGIWYLYDVVVIAAGDFRDGDGLRVARWEVAGEDLAASPSQRRVNDLEDRVQMLESHMSELGERLDFAERLLAQARERGPLPKG
ncbi:MAG TPA: TM2 domain-containing protein [Gemmatimonadales bacterium]|nr:TM2 domain-containing protein [Gemmatimonadales bacterium]